MFTESEDIGFQYEYNPERDFRNWKCKICKHYTHCPTKWQCIEMKKFVKREKKYEMLDDDDPTI